jgi:hypothetical protein
MTPTSPQVSTPNAQLTLGSWDSARHWLSYAGQFERCKLYCQVMLGFELITLKKLHCSHGGDRKSTEAKSSDQNDHLIRWDDVVAKELGLKHGSAVRFEAMARNATPILKKLPALKEFDPISKPIALLPAPQKAALEKGLRKMTDGITQKEFGEHLGLWKVPQGSGAKGRKPGEGGRKKLSLAEQAELLRAQATEDWQALGRTLVAYGSKFTA